MLQQLSQSKPRLIALLEAASQGREDLALAAFEERQIRWAIDTGLGPLLFQTTKADPPSNFLPLWPHLKSADLTAQVLTGEQLDAMGEIIDACAAEGHVLTLLKGISICDEHYPSAHLRTMRDMDFLVDNQAFPSVESILLKLGYRRQSKSSPELWEKHHHGMPLFHPGKRIWVEHHRGLVSPGRKISSAKAFSSQNIKTQLVPSKFQGKKVTRLSAELQLVYIACHWAHGLDVIGGIIPMLDIIYLLKNTKDRFDWDRIMGWMDDSLICGRLYLILSYLHKYQLISIDPQILCELFVRQNSFGNINLKVMHSFMDRYVVDGKSFGWLLSSRNLHIFCQSLLLPGPPIRNLIMAPKNLLPSFLGLRSNFY